MPPDGVRRLAARSSVVDLTAGDTLYSSGQPADRVFVLLSGRVGAWRGFGPAPGEGDGTWYFIADTPLTTLCLENVITGIPYYAEMQALAGRTRVLTVPADALAELLTARPGTGLDIARHIARRLQAFTEQTVDLVLLDSSRRLAKYLLRLLEPDGVTRAMTQAELAGRLGTSRQSVNAMLARFVDRGWIAPAGRGRYRIEDEAAMRRHARESSPTGAERFS